jgi:hypothetical protein
MRGRRAGVDPAGEDRAAFIRAPTTPMRSESRFGQIFQRWLNWDATMVS